MLEPTSIFDERATPYPPGTDFSNILTDEMRSLYQLSFLLTADLGKTEQCFISGMGECEEEIGVFMAWTRGQARRAILKHVFDAILGLNAFERFVYVMSVLERQSDDECSILLKCSRRDVVVARSLALECLTSNYNAWDQSLEAVGAWRTMFVNHCA
jgi:hypothetical protein